MAGQGQRAGRGGLLVGGVEVVFQQHRDAVQRPAQLAGFALLVELVGQGEGVGVEGQHRPQPGAFLVEGLDALLVQLAELAGGVAARALVLGQLGQRSLVQRKIGRGRRRCGGSIGRYGRFGGFGGAAQ